LKFHCALIQVGVQCLVLRRTQQAVYCRKPHDSPTPTPTPDIIAWSFTVLDRENIQFCVNVEFPFVMALIRKLLSVLGIVRRIVKSHY
jgi:hypothetical protein